MDIIIPKKLDASTITRFYKDTMDDLGLHRPKEINFDFEKLSFIRPAGLVTLSNMVDLIQLKYPKTEIFYSVPDDYTEKPREFPAVDFLDDSLFFEKVMGQKLHPASNERKTTNGLKKLRNDTFDKGYINNTISWLKLNAKLKSKSLSFLDTALGEIFNNILDHSGSPIGGSAFAQHYPRTHEINLCIADCGMGIANTMKKEYTLDRDGNILDTDAKMINYATFHKVTTKSTPRNRGVGLEHLVTIIENNKGFMRILSNQGSLVYNGNQQVSSKKRILTDLGSYYDGTLILLSINTKTLDEEDEEDLTWE
jgi:hypothetical protein